MKRMLAAAWTACLLVGWSTGVMAQGSSGPDAAKQDPRAKLTKQLDALKLLHEEHDKIELKIAELSTQIEKTAELAYAQAPNKDKGVTEILTKAARRHVGNDNFEDAARIAKLLAENGNQDPAIVQLAGLASFVVGDYDTADKYLNQAKTAGQLSRLGNHWLSQLESYRKLWAAEKKIRDAEAKADDLPRVKFKTNRGDIVIELFENDAPNTVANFVNLVEKGFYNDLTFHRVLPGFMAQGGCPEGTGRGGPGYTIDCECDKPDYRRHFRGTLSMAHAGPDTGGSQFFLTFVPTGHLDGKHTAFGRIVEGMDVLSRLQKINPGQGEAAPDRIVKATVVRKRDHEYKPKTNAKDKDK